MTTRTPALRAGRVRVLSNRYRLWFWLAVIVLLFVFLSLVKSVLLPFVVGILSAYFLDPAVRRLHARGWSRTLAAMVITAGFFLVAVILCIVLVPLITQQLSGFVSELPATLQGLQDRYGDDIQYYFSQLNLGQGATIKEALSNFGGTLAEWAGKVASGALRSGLALLNVIALIFLTPVVAFYLLRDWDLLVRRFDELLPRGHAPLIRTQLREIDRTLAGFLRGQTNVCLIMATYYGLCLTAAGLNFGLGVGIMTGLLLFMPFVGFAIGCTTGIVIALFQFGGSMHTLIILAIYGVGMVLEGNILTPKLVGNKVGLHPLWIIFGMLSGAALFGFVGVLISVPVTSVLGVLVRFTIAQYLESPLYKGAVRKSAS